MTGLESMLQSLLSFIVPAMVLVAVGLLWRRNRSPWLLLAIAGEAAGLGFRTLLAVAPDLINTAPKLFSLWTLTGFAFAVGLLGYALEPGAKK